MVVQGMLPVKKEIWGELGDRGRRAPVDEVVGSVKILNPIFGRHVCVDEEGAEDIISGAYEALCLPVLW